LKGLKRIETQGYWPSQFTPYIEKTVVVPERDKHIESMLLFIYKDDSIKNE